VIRGKIPFYIGWGGGWFEVEDFVVVLGVSVRMVDRGGVKWSNSDMGNVDAMK
jgi:hypothetical protein